MKCLFLRSRQNGAALVVGLILLLAITLLAVASMNASRLDLMMASNEQYHSRAFYAAETGIESAWRTESAFSSNADYPATMGAYTTDTLLTGDDSYKYRVTRPDNGTIEPAPAGNSGNRFGVIRFRIEAHGKSERGSRATHVQELYLEVPRTDDFEILRGSDSSSACGTTDLDSTISAC